MNRMDGKICVVTGSTQGLGAAIARRLAEAGAAGLVTLGRNAARGEAVAAAITRDTGAPVHFVKADLGSVPDCRRVIAEAEQRFGRVDVLVNAGALTDRGTILDTSPELFDALFAVNVRGPYFLMQEAIRLMIREMEETLVEMKSGCAASMAKRAQVGRLLGMTKLLDMVLQDEDLDHHIEQFFQGSGKSVRSFLCDGTICRAESTVSG